MAKGPFEVSVGIANQDEVITMSFGSEFQGETWGKAMERATSVAIRDGDGRMHRIYQRPTGVGEWQPGGIWGDGR